MFFRFKRVLQCVGLHLLMVKLMQIVCCLVALKYYGAGIKISLYLNKK